MPISEFLYLCLVIVAFLAFGVTLAWGESQTRNFVRPEDANSDALTEDHGFKKAA